MAGTKMELGATGKTVAGNVKRVREAQGLTYTEVSKAMGKLGRPVSPLAVRRIEEGGRRVDVDDLMALGVALDVSATTFLLPDVDDEKAPISITGSDTTVTSRWLWEWLRIDSGMSSVETKIDWYVRALPMWRRMELGSALKEIAALERRQRESSEAMEAKRAEHGDD